MIYPNKFPCDGTISSIGQRNELSGAPFAIISSNNFFCRAVALPAPRRFTTVYLFPLSEVSIAPFFNCPSIMESASFASQAVILHIIDFHHQHTCCMFYCQTVVHKHLHTELPLLDIYMFYQTPFQKLEIQFSD